VKCWWWHAGIDLTPTSIKKLPFFFRHVGNLPLFVLNTRSEEKREGHNQRKGKKRGSVDKWQILTNQHGN
jgi:hypothetical protein